MIVVDASVVLDLLLQKPNAQGLRDRLFADADDLHAPHLIDLEIVQVLRRYVRNGEMSSARAKMSLNAWMLLPVARHSHAPLLERIWALRDIVSAYDAAYVALAGALQAPLLTTDARLARAHGQGAQIELL